MQRNKFCRRITPDMICAAGHRVGSQDSPNGHIYERWKGWNEQKKRCVQSGARLHLLIICCRLQSHASVHTVLELWREIHSSVGPKTRSNGAHLFGENVKGGSLDVKVTLLTSPTLFMSRQLSSIIYRRIINEENKPIIEQLKQCSSWKNLQNELSHL